MIRFKCLSCQRVLKVGDAYVGKTCKCRCGKLVTVPSAEEARAQLEAELPPGSSDIIPALGDLLPPEPHEVLWHAHVGRWQSAAPAGGAVLGCLLVTLWATFEPAGLALPLPAWLGWVLVAVALGWLGFMALDVSRSSLTVTGAHTALQRATGRVVIPHPALGSVKLEDGRVHIASTATVGPSIAVAVPEQRAEELVRVLKQQKRRFAVKA